MGKNQTTARTTPTKSRPANVVVAGSPAKVIKQLDPELGFKTRMDYFAKPAELERFFEQVNRDVLAGNSFFNWLWSIVYPASGK